MTYGALRVKFGLADGMCVEKISQVRGKFESGLGDEPVSAWKKFEYRAANCAIYLARVVWRRENVLLPNGDQSRHFQTGQPI